jgi:3-hexulose-6-phosphate synthase
MKLQIAFDLFSSDDVLKALKELHDLVDIIEIGTPLLLREGVQAVTKVKNKYPDFSVLADMKIIDGAAVEASMAFEAGADIVTVLAHAEEKTLENVKNAAIKFKQKVMVDFITIRDIQNTVQRLENHDLDYFCIHTAHDTTVDGKTPIDDLKRIHPLINVEKIAVAGGLNPDLLKTIQPYHPEIVVVGSFITRAKRMRASAVTIKEMMGGIKEQW